MKQSIVGIFFALLSLHQAFAIECDEIELAMTASDTENGFEGVATAKVQLMNCNREGRYQSMSLIAQRVDPETQKSKWIFQVLTISPKGVMTLPCGCTHYISRLDNPSGTNQSERFSINLVDTRTCKESHHDHHWNGHVRHGFGFCGTFDAVMNLEGDIVQ